MSLDRRRFISLTSSTAALWLSGCKTTHSQLSSDDQQLSVRQRWTPDADDAFKEQFVLAVDWLKANDRQTFPAEDPRSYLKWSTIVRVHQQSCHHGEWLIFPWHRLYIQYFEQACRYALQDRSFALPYWDWTIDRRVPEEFFHNPLLLSERKLKEEDEVPEEFVGQKAIDDLLASEDWSSMHSRAKPRMGIRVPAAASMGGFERGPHNGVHNSVGGVMANPLDSPNDPLFWLHHCNIDRVWATWQDRHPNLLVPPSNTGGSLVKAPSSSDNSTQASTLALRTVFPIVQDSPWEDNLLDLDLKGNGSEKNLIPAIPVSSYTRSFATSRSVKSILRIADLGYTYDTLPVQTKIGTQNFVRLKSVREDNWLTGTMKFEGSRMSITISFSGTSSAALITRFKNKMTALVSLTAAGLNPPDEAHRSSVIVRFFAMNASANADRSDFYAEKAFNLPEYLGVHSFFAHVHGTDGSNTQDSSMEITRWFRKYLNNRGNEELRIVAVALDTAAGNAPVALFPNSSGSELRLEFALSNS